MKHFIVEATYCAPLETVRAAYARHRAWLQKGYDLGLFLCSGPKAPPTGGYLVARAESVDVLETMFEEEPYTRRGSRPSPSQNSNRSSDSLDGGVVQRDRGVIVCAGQNRQALRHGCHRLANNTATIPMRKMPSNVPAPPIEATGAPSPRMAPRLSKSAPISVPRLPPI
jgi:uncharacterized protein YciI